MAQVQFSVYRYNPDIDNAPRMQDFSLETQEGQDMMVLDALIAIKRARSNIIIPSFMP